MAKRVVILDFNCLLSQKRLANVVTGDYNAGLEFMEFYKVYRGVGFVFAQL